MSELRRLEPPRPPVADYERMARFWARIIQRILEAEAQQEQEAA